jgi:glycosyltransferase involved in cell wall biosynthesis
MARVDVVVPVRDGADTVREALDSLSNQTFRDIRILVVDDRSTDATAEIVQAMAEADPRIVYLRNPGSGICDASNYGVECSDSDFVGRMDADDLSRPNRLEMQLAFLAATPACVVLGTGVTLFGLETGTVRLPRTPKRLRLAMQLFNGFTHSSLVMRARAVREVGMYRREYEFAEDYDLLSRLVFFGEGHNLPEPLVMRRTHAGQISRQKRDIVTRLGFRIASRNVMTARGLTDLPPATALRMMAGIAVQLGPRYARLSARSLWGALGCVLEGGDVERLQPNRSLE